MSNVRVKEIEHINPHTIRPEYCAAWLANLNTLIATPTINEHGEVLYKMEAQHPGIQSVESVTFYRKLPAISQ